MFLQSCDHLFVPPLSARVEIGEYAAKIARRATRFEAWDHVRGLIGLAAVYCDHDPARPAFLTSISVIPEEIGRGLGTILLDAVVDHLRELGFRELELETGASNARGLAFYARQGFVITARSGESLTLRLSLSSLPPSPTHKP